MTRVSFESNKVFLADLLKEAEAGKLQLPDFQRGWVWDDSGIRALLTSIAQSFPVGALMALESGGEVRFKPRLIEGAPIASANVEPEILLLDGQQRITSLFQTTMSSRVVETQNTQKRAIKRWYYIDMEKALDPLSMQDDIIIGVPENKKVTKNFGRDLVLDLSTPEQEYKLRMFPTHAIFDDDPWEEEYQDYWEYDKEALRFYTKFRKEVLEAFSKYQVPVISLAKDTKREAVCLVFEKVNTGGKKLDAFELLTAIYAADEFDLREDWYGTKEVQGRQQKLAQYDPLKTLASTDFLQAISLSSSFSKRQKALEIGVDAPPVSCTRKSVLELPLHAYREWSDDVMVGFERAAKFLQMNNVFWYKDVPYKTQLVPLAAILSSLDDRWEEEPVRRKVAQWYWCGVFGELYGSAVETRFAKDLPEVIAWIDGGEPPTTVQEAIFVPDRLHTLRSRLSAAYKGIHVLLMHKGAPDFRSGQKILHTTYFDEQVDIHHIFPKDWCAKQKPPLPARLFDCIVNKTPLSARTNRKIGGSAPSVYLRKLEAQLKIDNNRMDELLAGHLIEPGALRADAFDAFFEDRKERILQMIESAMEKSIQRSAEEEEEVGDEPIEYEESFEVAE